MFVYEKKLQYPVKIKNPNPRLIGLDRGEEYCAA